MNRCQATTKASSILASAQTHTQEHWHHGNRSSKARNHQQVPDAVQFPLGVPSTTHITTTLFLATHAMPRHFRKDEIAFNISLYISGLISTKRHVFSCKEMSRLQHFLYHASIISTWYVVSVASAGLCKDENCAGPPHKINVQLGPCNFRIVIPPGKYQFLQQ